MRANVVVRGGVFRKHGELQWYYRPPYKQWSDPQSYYAAISSVKEHIVAPLEAMGVTVCTHIRVYSDDETRVERYSDHCSRTLTPADTIVATKPLGTTQLESVHMALRGLPEADMTVVLRADMLWTSTPFASMPSLDKITVLYAITSVPQYADGFQVVPKACMAAYKTHLSSSEVDHLSHLRGVAVVDKRLFNACTVGYSNPYYWFCDRQRSVVKHPARWTFVGRDKSRVDIAESIRGARLGDRTQLIIPMAGMGSRFSSAGYSERKPFIKLHGGAEMVKWVHRTMHIPEERTILVCLDEDKERTKLLFPKAKVVGIEYQPDGTPCSVLKALPFINRKQPVLIANSDQICNWDADGFYGHMHKTNANAGVLTFNESQGDSKWSYASVTDTGIVKRVVAKKAISQDGIVGVYWWRTGELMLNAFTNMIRADDRTKGEFYVCPSMNYVPGGGVVAAYPCIDMHGTGTPEDLTNTLDVYGERFFY